MHATAALQGLQLDCLRFFSGVYLILCNSFFHFGHLNFFWATRLLFSNHCQTLKHGWCDDTEPAFGSEFQCTPGTSSGECCEASNCEDLMCNGNKRVHDSQSNCICSDGFEKFGIDVGRYRSAAGCRASWSKRREHKNWNRRLNERVLSAKPNYNYIGCSV